MVVFVTDDEQVIELRAPGVTNIGRASNNDVIPESKSVSKTHAQLTITFNASKQKWECFLEDLNSGNGTFLGASPLEMYKLNKKEVIHFGDYVRFGHGTRMYKLAESAMTLNGAAPAAITAPLTYQTMPMSARGGTQPVPPLNNVTAALTTGRGTFYPGGKGGDSARSNRSDGQPKNMTISINYPTGGNVQQQAVSVVIDPNKIDGNRNHSSNSGNRKSDDSVQSGRQSDRSRQHWQGAWKPPIHLHTLSPAHPLTKSLIHTLTYALPTLCPSLARCMETYPLTLSHAYSLAHPLTQSLIHTLTHPLSIIGKVHILPSSYTHSHAYTLSSTLVHYHTLSHSLSYTHSL